MKYTGIVRRLDSLGRIVIPREYRKMHKIKESDPLEIIAMENGEILIKKVDVSAELIASGMNVVNQLAEETGLNIMLSSSERFLSGNGTVKNILNDTILPSKIQNIIENRKVYQGRSIELGLTDNGYICLYPICATDVFGAILMFSETEISEENEKLLRISAKILSGIMQKY